MTAYSLVSLRDKLNEDLISPFEYSRGPTYHVTTSQLDFRSPSRTSSFGPVDDQEAPISPPQLQSNI